ncbi:hypothetical protein [Vitreimonas flagellata]|uniref:hypothetical protein n=1 Tax=Vitreimonas flagellata TaxID=2560861 RepID=UPI001074FC8A|nr:hypothetical protein [Vitreimonas flagellata]
MKKFGFIAASMGTAVLLAVGAASVAHMVTGPGEIVEEANAAEIVPLGSPSARPENAPARVRAAGVQLARAESPQKTRAAEVPPPQRVASSRAPVRSSDDDDDDDGDDD